MGSFLLNRTINRIDHIKRLFIEQFVKRCFARLQRTPQIGHTPATMGAAAFLKRQPAQFEVISSGDFQ